MNHTLPPNGAPDLPAALINARTERHLTKEQLGRYVKRSNAAIHSYEKGAKIPHRIYSDLVALIAMEELPPMPPPLKKQTPKDFRANQTGAGSVSSHAFTIDMMPIKNRTTEDLVAELTSRGYKVILEK